MSLPRIDVTATESPGPDLVAIEAKLRVDIESHRLKLPVLPNVAMEVLSSTLDDGVDSARLAGLIQKDQSLATHVLRVVNSPSFRASIEIVALQQAIARLGMVRIREIALTASLKNVLSCKGAFHSLMDDAWQTGLATGLWSKEFARARRKNVEVSYLGGLLHNVGCSVLAVELCNRDAALSLGDAKYLLAALGRDAGMALVEHWKLPELVGVCIRHVGDFAAAGTHADDVATVEAGRAVAIATRQGTLDLAQIIDLESVQHLNMYPEDVEDLLGNTEQINASLESMVL